MSKPLTLPRSAKRTQRIGAAPNASVPMLAELAKQAKAIALLERLASMPLYVELANVAHGINSYFETASVGTAYEPSLSFYLYLSQLNRWTDPKYVQAINDVQNAVAAFDYARKDTEHKDSHNRGHKWTIQIPTGDETFPTVRLEVSLDCYENKETSECRRIQVGTRMVEEPIYRTDCVAPEAHSGELPAPVIALEGLV